MNEVIVNFANAFDDLCNCYPNCHGCPIDDLFDANGGIGCVTIRDKLIKIEMEEKEK